MEALTKIYIGLIIIILISSCELDPWRFDGERIFGPYLLIAIDTKEEMHVAYEISKKPGTTVERIPPTVYAVGFEGKYIFAAQHPSYDKNRTNYYILDSEKDNEFSKPNKSVIGPFSKEEYKKVCLALGISNPFTFKIRHKSLE